MSHLKYFYLLLLTTFLQTTTLSASPEKTFIHADLKPVHAGMFSVFTYVIGVLHEYESKNYAGIHVDFEESGNYYSPEYGPNWWEYYCKPIDMGNRDDARVKNFSPYEYASFTIFVENVLTRSQVHDLITKYIHIRGEILEKVDSYVQEFFSNTPVIGIHYRGTDKIEEAPTVPYREVLKQVRKYIRENSIERAKIFVATDEAQFLEYMQNEFGDSVIFHSTLYSEDGRPIHEYPLNPYLQGEEALIDCLLLSKTDMLIRTSSNLSLWSTYFNLDLPVLELNKRYGQ